MMTRQYWISTNPADPTFDTPEAAIEDWMKTADTIPSAVSWTAEDGSQGVVGVEAQDWQRGPYWIIGLKEPMMIIQHSELGIVLAEQAGAQSEGSMWDTPDRSEALASSELRALLDENRRAWNRGEPGTIAAVLAFDGWWWKVLG